MAKTSTRRRDAHLVHEEPGQDDPIDRHLVHEVTSPQAFMPRLTAARFGVLSTFATMDHNIPTTDRSRPIDDPPSAQQVETSRKIAATSAFAADMQSPRSGIVHIIGPELGITQPGQTIGAATRTPRPTARSGLAFGIGTMSRACARHADAAQRRSQTMEIRVDGKLPVGVTAKDVILAIIGKIGTAAAPAT
jgi:3-isopropylmalate/(R)-2-methylmalate dehydratase large subunit